MISEENRVILDAAYVVISNDDSTEYMIQFLIDNIEISSCDHNILDNSHSIVMEYLSKKEVKNDE